jgi:hypothetical protein
MCDPNLEIPVKLLPGLGVKGQIMLMLKTGKRSGLLAMKGSGTSGRTGIVGCNHGNFLDAFPSKSHE